MGASAVRKYFSETLGEVARRDHHPPLRTFKEICEMLGEDMARVRGKMKLPGAPAAVINNRCRHVRTRAKWYEPKAFVKWWSEVKDA